MSKVLRAGLLAGLALATTAVAVAPAVADTIAAPAGDTGFWSGLNGPLGAALGTVVTGSVAWIAQRVHAVTGVAIKSKLTDEVRQTILTGIYQGAHVLEIKIDDAMSPADRAKLIAKGVDWALDRLPGPAGAIARLALPQSALAGIAEHAVQRYGVSTSEATMLNVIFYREQMQPLNTRPPRPRPSGARCCAPSPRSRRTRPRSSPRAC